MLNPSVDRLDYGEKLQTPKGFQLSYAVATSYSLELDTLLCLPLALSLNGTLEGNPHGGARPRRLNCTKCSGRDSHPLDGKPNFKEVPTLLSLRTSLSWSHVE